MIFWFLCLMPYDCWFLVLVSVVTVFPCFSVNSQNDSDDCWNCSMVSVRFLLFLKEMWLLISALGVSFSFNGCLSDIRICMLWLLVSVVRLFGFCCGFLDYWFSFRSAVVSARAGFWLVSAWIGFCFFRLLLTSVSALVGLSCVVPWFWFDVFWFQFWWFFRVSAWWWFRCQLELVSPVSSYLRFRYPQSFLQIRTVVAPNMPDARKWKEELGDGCVRFIFSLFRTLNIPPRMN